MIDLRSDTVTRPTGEMRRAMADAAVGDDVLGDDPTVRQLEQRTAAVLAKEAAVFMPSGTMSNQVAVRAHTEPGDEILMDREAHMYYYEGGAPAALSGATCRLLPGERGVFSPADVRAAIRPANVHFPRTRLVCVENTHNRGGGSVWPVEQIEAVTAAAREAGLAAHLDGARLWNASVAAGVSEAAYAAGFDSVSVCFSKGLGAPVGSALAGSGAFIERARRFRKQFGGGMRQAGIVAAGALHALDRHRDRLADDHANARRLAAGLAAMAPVSIDPAAVETNIVCFALPGCDAAGFCAALGKAGVLVLPVGSDRVRAVTHLGIAAADIDAALERIAAVPG